MTAVVTNAKVDKVIDQVETSMEIEQQFTEKWSLINVKLHNLASNKN